MESRSTSDSPHPGFFQALFDTRFDNLITPMLIRVVYIAMIVILAIGGVIVIIAAFADKVGNGIIALIAVPIVSLLYLILGRLWLELIIVLFKIRSSVEVIESRK